MSNQEALKHFYAEMREIHHLRSTSHLLGWDQMVNMPHAAAQARAEQMALLEKIIYQRLTDPRLLDLIGELKSSSLNEPDRINLLEAEYEITRLKKLPKDFVERQALASSISQMTWADAKTKSDFPRVKPHLEELINLAREESSLIGYDDHPYDALLDNYDRGLKISKIKPLLLNLAEQLANLLGSITEKQRKLKRPNLNQLFPQPKQYALNRWISARIGYDYTRGRLDVSPHPFQSSISVNDKRITTRYDESDFTSSLYATLHEAGHALYEQGLNPEYAGVALGTYCSMGIHESQSRFWENIIGRSRAFVDFLYPEVLRHFPDLHPEVTADQLWLHINWVEPSLIRVDADEVTYSLHVVIRTLLEEQLITNSLEVEDLPTAWNDLYKRYLGLSVPDYKNGVMQDIHWYGGSFGYFPSYVLGNLYGASLCRAIQSELGSIETLTRAGDFLPILNWLRNKVHRKGRSMSAEQLLKETTGTELSTSAFVTYIKSKFLD